MMWLNRLHAGLARPLPAWGYYLLAGVLGAVVYAFIFPWAFFSGESGFWHDVRTDPTQHLSGFWALMADDWRFPLMWTQQLNWPQGASAAYSDSIPLAAIPLKLLRGVLAPTFNFFGFWVLSCYVLQAVAGAYFTRVVAGRSGYALLCGAGFSLLSGALMIRVPHSALSAQWTIILALALAVGAARDDWHVPALGRRLIVLVTLTAAIHPYLSAMVLPLGTLALVQTGVQRRALWPALAWAAALTGVTLAVFLLVGFLVPASGGPAAESGYTHGSMNLLSPFLGSSLASGVLLRLPGMVLDATGLQIDGHFYLGAGVWGTLLLAAGLAVRHHARRAAWRVLLRRYAPLAVLLGGFTVYALSNKVYLAQHLLFEYPLPVWLRPLTEVFRGSGRFFWPAGYAVLLGVAAWLARVRLPVKPVWVLLLLAVQWLDMGPHRDYLREAAARSPYYDGQDFAYWDAQARAARVVYLLPAYGCGSDIVTTLFVQYFASLHQRPFNTAFVARVNVDCAEKARPLTAGFAAGSLVVLNGRHYREAEARALMAVHRPRDCQWQVLGLVCRMR